MSAHLQHDPVDPALVARPAEEGRAESTGADIRGGDAGEAEGSVRAGGREGAGDACNAREHGEGQDTRDHIELPQWYMLARLRGGQASRPKPCRPLAAEN